MNKENILNTRLKRQYLHPRLDNEKAYWDLFRLLQPVSPIHATCPGEPPSLWPRTIFNDKILTDVFRSSRKLIKGRFLGDSIGYVLADDLQTYANAFCKPIKLFNDKQERVLAALKSCGQLTPRQIKEETGLLNKELMPALHRLQKAFLVFEDQLDGDWERPWCPMEEVRPDIFISEELRLPSAIFVMSQFLTANIFATFEQIKDWSRLPVQFLKSLLETMQTEGMIMALPIKGLGDGYILTKDQKLTESAMEHAVCMLHKADPLVKAHGTELKKLFGKDETLHYLLLDGELQGAVLGHWRIGPYDVDDVLVLRSPQECEQLQEEILSVVSEGYVHKERKILQYCGKEI